MATGGAAVAQTGAARGRSIAIGLLSFAAGAMDALAFLTLGEVFTSAMSGNTILMGLALGQGRIFAALHSLTALVGYACGVALAVLPLRRRPHGIGYALGFEVLFLAAFAGFWTAWGGPSDPVPRYALIALSAIAMGLQGAVGRAIQIPGVPTIVITSTLTAIIGRVAEKLFDRGQRVPAGPTQQQMLSFLAYLASAIVCGLATSRWLGALPFAPLVAVLALVAGLRLRMLAL